MSWSASFEVDENCEVVEDSVFESNVTPDVHAVQYEAALNAVWAMLRSEAFGTRCKFMVTMSGHGNENHVPLAGWSNDSVSINIIQI